MRIWIHILAVICLVGIIFFYFGNLCPTAPKLERFYFYENILQRQTDIENFKITDADLIAYSGTSSDYPCETYKIRSGDKLIKVSKKVFQDFVNQTDSDCDGCLVFRSVGVFGGGLIQWYSSDKYLCNSTSDIRLLADSNLDPDCVALKDIH